MVTSASSYSRHGLRDWLLQRVTAIVLGLYFLALTGFFVRHPHPDFVRWHAFMLQPGMRMIALIVVLNLLVHGWIGMWTVITDYIKSTPLRLLFYAVLGLGFLACFIWSIAILWGV